MRLDSLVRLINGLSESLQQDVEALSRLDLSSPSCEQEARERIFPTLRRFNFDQRIRDECRALIRLLLPMECLPPSRPAGVPAARAGLMARPP